MNRINILWFTNTVSGAGKYLGVELIDGGWIESLEKNIKKIDNINLGVAFYSGNAQEIKKIEGERVTYFIIPDQRSKLKLGIDKQLHNIEIPNSIEHYLEIINEFNPDIINVFGTEKNYGMISHYTDVPVVIHLQGILSVLIHKWFPDGLNQFQIFRLSSIIKLIKGSSLFHYYYYYQNAAEREKKIIKSCKYFIGRTSWDKRIINLLNSKSKYFHVDETLREEFYMNKWKLNKNNTFKILSTIQGNIYKGLETILETASILSDNHLFIWNIAGIDGSEETVKIFEKKYKKRFKDYNVNFLGRLNTIKLIEKLLISDLFVHPSHIDNSPNSVCEAMMLGIPIISTNVGGVSSLLKNEKEGILIQDGDPYAFAGAILEIKNNPELFVRTGNNARERAFLRHDQLKIVNNMIDVYNQILDENCSSKSISLDRTNQF